MEIGCETGFWSDPMGLMATSLNVGHDDPMPLLWTTSADSTLPAQRITCQSVLEQYLERFMPCSGK